MHRSTRASTFSCCNLSALCRIIGEVLSLCREMLCCPFCNALPHGHIPAAVLLFFVIILLVAMGEALLSQLFTKFTVGMDESRAALRQGVILKDICHVMEQPCHRKEYLRRCRSTLPFQKALCVAVPLFRCHGQPLDALLFVSVDHLPLEQQLPQQILSMGVAGLGGGVDVVHGLAGVFSYYLAFQIFLAQAIGRIVVSVVGGVFQPLDAQLRIMDAHIIREQQLSQSILGRSVTAGRCLVEPVHGGFAVRYHKAAIQIQLSHKVLSMDIAALCKFPHTLHGVIPLRK